MKILVVDDEKLVIKGIQFNLEHEGYQDRRVRRRERRLARPRGAAGPDYFGPDDA